MDITVLDAVFGKDFYRKSSSPFDRILLLLLSIVDQDIIVLWWVGKIEAFIVHRFAQEVRRFWGDDDFPIIASSHVIDTFSSMNNFLSNQPSFLLRY